MAKKKSKIKRFLKKVAPIAMLGLGAAALAKNKRLRATDSPGDASALAKRLMTQNNAYKPTYPVQKNLSRWNSGALNPSGDVFGMDGTGDIQYAMPAKGGRIVKTKKGGVARRGFGRAYLKGRK